MVNLDTVNETRAAILQKMSDAIKNDDKESYLAALADLTNDIEAGVKADFEEYKASQDVAILAQRGVRQLTSKEREFYNSVITAMQSANPQQSISNGTYILPDTVVEKIFADIREAHPLLDLIDFRYTGALTKIILSTTSGTADWDPLGTTVSDELGASFAQIDLTAGQLTAYMPVAKYMLELGPEWLDRYVREVLYEALATALEAAIVDGDGKNKPIGMGRQLSNAVDGVYPRKSDTAELTQLDPAAFGTILGALSVNANSKLRPVTDLVMIVNPSDYYGKVFSGATVRTADGTYRSDVLPYPCKVIVSPAVPSNKAIFGMPKRYFMGLGTGVNGNIEYSDHYKFLERERYYLIVLYGNGRALDPNDFIVCDIENLTPTVQHVIIDGTVTTEASSD